MQDDRDYVSTWEPKTSMGEETPPSSEPVLQEPERSDAPRVVHVTAHTLKFGDGEGRMEYTVSNQHNAHPVQDGHILRRTYYSKQVGSLGQSFYDDGRWNTTATTPKGVKFQRLETPEATIFAARNDAIQRGFEEAETQPVERVTVEAPESGATYHSRLTVAGFRPTGTDFLGKNEYVLMIGADDGGTYDLRVFESATAGVGLRVQYEKNNLIDGNRTSHAHFDTLSEALEFVGGYNKFTEQQGKAETLSVVTAGSAAKQELTRIRMR